MPCALPIRSEEHTSELQSPCNLVCRLLLEKKHKHAEPVAGGLPGGHVQAVIGEHGRSTVRSNRSRRYARTGPASRTGKHSFFFFNDTATTEIYTLSLHDALPILATTATMRSSTMFRRIIKLTPPAA